MVFKKVSHIVNRPGTSLGDRSVAIPIAEELITTPGIPKREVDVSFYARTQPLESQSVSYTHLTLPTNREV